MASKKALGAAIKAAEEAEDVAMAALNIAKDDLKAAEDKHALALREVRAAKLALAQSAPLSKTALAFLQAAAGKGGHSYSPRHSFWRGKGGGKTADGILAEKLKELDFIQTSGGGFHVATVATATDAGRAKLAEQAGKGGVAQ